MQHPEVAKPMSKEPHFFTSCRRAGPACRARTPDLLDEAWYIRDAFQQDYVVANGLNVAAMEASADYAQGGKPLAKLLYKSFPWLKLVFALREPISRAISWRTMMADKFDKGCTNEDRYAECIENTLSTRNYSEPLQGWLEVWPTDQLMIIQVVYCLYFMVEKSFTFFLLPKREGLTTFERNMVVSSFLILYL